MLRVPSIDTGPSICNNQSGINARFFSVSFIKIKVMSLIANSRKYFEVGAVFVTGFCKFIFVDLLSFKFWYIVIASLFWVGYVVR
jgi:hypothetical protein